MFSLCFYNTTLVCDRSTVLPCERAGLQRTWACRCSSGPLKERCDFQAPLGGQKGVLGQEGVMAGGGGGPRGPLDGDSTLLVALLPWPSS